ncbi:MFS transporter [Psittacicella hinzii]|uniref:Major facilitator superfamily (MFS) profile domain-containing protein n=1 Tax=Psittacicella hinzii TaxID=2028575 RepID=A0A3A1YR75_9GAMM|nr:MFS transporter [Psittacicella hinzii]RIY40011.1 hypothetical protein CKF58_01210 [Psittacicella hinzii]
MSQSKNDTLIGKAGSTYVGFDAITPHQQALQKKLPNKILLIFTLGLLAMNASLVNDAVIPALLDLSTYFNASVEQIQAIIPYFAIGLGIGQLIWGPCIDRFGRKSIIMLLVVLGLILNGILQFTANYTALLTVRVLQGIVFSGIGSIPSIVLKDAYSPKDFVIYNSYLMSIFFFGPALAPMIGGWLLLIMPWKGIYYFISLLILFSAAVFLIKIPETLDPEKRQSLNTIRILKNYGAILKDPRSVVLILAFTTFELASFAYPTLLPAVLMIDYKVSSTNSSYFLAMLIVFLSLGMYVSQHLIKKGVNLQTIWTVAAAGQVLAVALNILVIYTVKNEYTITAAMCSNTFFSGMISSSIMMVYLTRYPHITGTASSLMQAIMLLVPGLVISHCDFIIKSDRHEGTTMLLITGAAIALSGLCSLFYRAVWGINSSAGAGMAAGH